MKLLSAKDTYEMTRYHQKDKNSCETPGFVTPRAVKHYTCMYEAVKSNCKLGSTASQRAVFPSSRPR